MGVGQKDRVPQTTKGEFLGYFNASHVAKYTIFAGPTGNGELARFVTYTQRKPKNISWQSRSGSPCKEVSRRCLRNLRGVRGRFVSLLFGCARGNIPRLSSRPTSLFSVGNRASYDDTLVVF